MLAWPNIQKALLRRAGFFQEAVKLVFESQFFFLQNFNFFMRPRLNAGLNILNLLIEFVVLFKKTQEVTVSCLKLRNKIAVLWKHGNTPLQLDSFNRNIVRSNCQMHQIVEKTSVKTHETAGMDSNQGLA